MKEDILRLTENELQIWLLSHSQKAYRAKQIFEWLHQKRCRQFSEMTNLSKELRCQLEDVYQIMELTTVRHQVDEVDGTQKFLFRLADGCLTETVLMKYRYGYSVCISSQVGCRMGCTFCASTIGGLERQMTASEMLLQVYQVEAMIDQPVHSIVMMGMGEPLDNYQALIRFIELVTASHGRNLGQRRITVSTCGIGDKMIELANLGLQINLAVSLHQANQDKRRDLMPIANRYNLTQLKQACHYYIEKTGRRLTFEYALIAGQTDRPADAEAIIAFAKDLLCHINLIPLNPVEGRDYQASLNDRRQLFKGQLEKAGIPVSLRRTLGSNIDAACGQLRKKEKA